MIKSFKHKRLERFYRTGDHRGLNFEHVRRIKLILSQLNASETIEDMNVPSYRLHRLRGEMRLLWAVTVRANWRIVFEFEDGDAFHVDMLDYH